MTMQGEELRAHQGSLEQLPLLRQVAFDAPDVCLAPAAPQQSMASCHTPCIVEKWSPQCACIPLRTLRGAR